MSYLPITHPRARRTSKTAAAITAVLVLAGAAQGLSSAQAHTNAHAKPSTAHAAPRTLVIGTDLPLQGGSADTAAEINKMVQLYLDQINNRVGRFRLALKTYDDSTAQKGQWDSRACKNNANAHAANANEIAVLGTFNSGCAMLELPVLNDADPGPMLMVSPANTFPELTKHWGPGTPQQYYPTGKRSYARVLTTDDYEANAAAKFAHRSLHVRRVFVLNDGKVYGKGLAHRFVQQAKERGIMIVGNKTWRPTSRNYKQLFRAVKPKHPDAVYLAGYYYNNGAQLIEDKVSILGGNRAVKLLAPDGFLGYPDLDAMPDGQQLYLTDTALPLQEVLRNNPVGTKLVAAYKRKYGRAAKSAYSLDAVAALQVIVRAIRRSNGTRAGVTSSVFHGAGIAVSAAASPLGEAFKISTKTGDTNLRQISVDRIVNHHEKFIQAERVRP